MTTMASLFTRAEYDRLPEGFPAQLIEGQLVKEPPPRYGHQRVGSRIRFQLKKLVGPDLVPDTPADVGIDRYNVFQPDIVVLEKRPDDETSDVGIPILAVEVLSPRTEKRDRLVKTGRLLDAGVREVWLIDRRRQAIEVHTSAGHRRYEGGEQAVSEAVEGFVLVPDTLFAR